MPFEFQEQLLQFLQQFESYLKVHQKTFLQIKAQKQNQPKQQNNSQKLQSYYTSKKCKKKCYFFVTSRKCLTGYWEYVIIQKKRWIYMLISMGADSEGKYACLLKEAGFNCVDFYIDDKPFDYKKALDAIKSAGLFVGQVHLPYLPNGSECYEWNNYKSFEDYILMPTIRGIEICSEMGCKTAVIHPYYGDDPEDTWKGNIEFICKLLPVLENCGVKLALENVYAHDGKNYLDSYVAYPQQLMKYIEYFDSDYIGICLDTGHANIFGIDVVAAVKLFGKKLFALHTNANAGEDQHAIPMTVPGWLDKVDYELMAQTLAEVGYEGTMNFEITSGNTFKFAKCEYINYAAAVARHLADIFDKSDL